MNFASALALIPMVATAFAIAKIVSAYVDSMARNPEGDKAGDRKTIALLGIAAVELMALLSFVVAFLIKG